MKNYIVQVLYGLLHNIHVDYLIYMIVIKKWNIKVTPDVALNPDIARENANENKARQKAWKIYDNIICTT